MCRSFILDEAAPILYEQRNCCRDIPETFQTHAQVDAVDVRGLGAVASHDDLARVLKYRRVEPRVSRARHKPHLEFPRLILYGDRFATDVRR